MTLHDITKVKIHACIKKHGAFFAFNNSQFREEAKDGITYVHLFSGLYAPKKNKSNLLKEIVDIYDDFKQKKKMINKTAIKTILTVPVLFSHQGEPIFPTIRIAGVENGNLFGDIFAEETIPTSDGGGKCCLQNFSIPFGWMQSIYSTEGIELPTLEETIKNWEMILSTDTVGIVENKIGKPLAFNKKNETRPYKQLFRFSLNDILPVGINPLLKWNKTQEVNGGKVRITQKEKELIISFHVRPQKCWICDIFVDSIKEDDQGYYIPVDIFEDDGIIEHLEQIIKRKLDL